MPTISQGDEGITGMDSKLKVSIVLATYKGSRFIKMAIQSVLAQTFGDYELIIIDDSPDDEILKIINDEFEGEERIIYLRNEKRLGFQGSLNLGLREARGEYIARIDDDDMWVDADKLSQQVAFLDTHPEYVLIGTGVIIADENGTELSRNLMLEHDDEIRERMLEQNCFIHSSVVYRKSVALGVGGYHEDKHQYQYEDYKLWLDLGTRGKLANLPIYGVKYTWKRLRFALVLERQVIPALARTMWLPRHYKDKYPHYWRGLLLKPVGHLEVLLRKISDSPPFIYLKNPLRSKFPTLWRVIAKVSGGVFQGMRGVIRLFT